MKQYEYYIIGGQYETVCYGGSNSLHSAKCKATRNMEYWDNWQGWKRPHVYVAQDTIEIESRGRILTRDGEIIRVPKPGAMPLY